MDVDPSVTGGRDGEGEGGKDEGEDPEGADPNDYDDVDDGPPKLRCINLDTHRTLKFLCDLTREHQVRKQAATFLLRHEYSLFMRYAICIVNTPNQKARFFVTGQPEIGKCFAFSRSGFCAHASRQELRLLLFPFPSARYGAAGILPRFPHQCVLLLQRRRPGNSENPCRMA